MQRGGIKPTLGSAVSKHTIEDLPHPGGYQFMSYKLKVMSHKLSKKGRIKRPAVEKNLGSGRLSACPLYQGKVDVLTPAHADAAIEALDNGFMTQSEFLDIRI